MSTGPRDDMASILDGRLIRMLDGESSDQERAEMEHLLATSPEARERHEELRRLGGTLTSGLAGDATPALPPMDLPERVRPRGESRVFGRPTRWQAAAAITVLMGVGLTVEPVRAFIASGARSALELLAPEGPTPVPVQEETAPVATGPSSVSFVPDGTTFVVSVATAQDAGTLRIEATDGTAVQASVQDGSGESLLVLPSELRVANRAGSTATYRLQIPRTLTLIEVRIEETRVASLDPAAGPGVWEFELAR